MEVSHSLSWLGSAVRRVSAVCGARTRMRVTLGMLFACLPTPLLSFGRFNLCTVRTLTSPLAHARLSAGCLHVQMGV